MLILDEPRLGITAYHTNSLLSIYTTTLDGAIELAETFFCPNASEAHELATDYIQPYLENFNDYKNYEQTN
jgi:hypothetical protein